MAKRRKSHNSRRHLSHHFHKKPSIFKRLNWFAKKHHIATGVILIILSFILGRLSFTNAFLSSSEVFMWSLLLSIGLFLAGFFTLIAHWRNNVLNFNARVRLR